MRFMQINAFYEWYLRTFYARRPGMEKIPYNDQISALVADGFACTHIHAPYLEPLGYDCEIVIANCPESQSKWAEEHGLPKPETPLDFANLILMQIEHFKPDVLYFDETVMYDSRYIRALSRRPPVVMGWRAAIIPPETDWTEFDLILSSDELCLRLALERGAKRSQLAWPHFPAFIAEAVADQPKVFDLVFYGQISPSHLDRVKVLNEIAKASRGWRGGFTPAFFLACGNPQALPVGMRMYDKGPVWSMDMHRIIKSGRIVVNAHIDLAAKKSLNMRTYEVIGTGSFILTEYSSVLGDFFVPGRELVTYDSHEDMIDKIYYYLEHEDEREEIARRGQARCQADYSAEKGGVVLHEIIQDLLSKNGYKGAARSEAVPAIAPEGAAVTLRGSFEDILSHLSKNLGSYPKEVPGAVDVGGNLIEYTDIHRFYFQSVRIYRDNFYGFKSSVANPLIIDCGAGIGLSSMYFGTHIPGVTVHAYEADPNAAAHLVHNLAVFKLGNVIPHAEAVWTHDRGVSFEDLGEERPQASLLPSVRLRDLLQGREVELLKLDVGGAEPDLLADCDGMLGTVNKIIAVIRRRPGSPSRLGEMLSVLERNGFRCFPFDLNGADSAGAIDATPFTACRSDGYTLALFAWK